MSFNNQTLAVGKQQGRSGVHEIINLEDPTNSKTNYEHDTFVSELATQCGNFLNWVSDKNTNLFAENIWKNDMKKKCALLYPELNTDEVKRLVDRDWKIMSEQNKKKIEQQYNEPKTEEELTDKAARLKKQILQLRRN